MPAKVWKSGEAHLLEKGLELGAAETNEVRYPTKHRERSTRPLN